jgi:hypothetical protein
MTPTERKTLRELHEVPIFVGDLHAELQWKVLTLAQLQLRSLTDLIKPGNTIVVDVAVRT